MNRIKDNRYLWIYGKHACLSALKNPNRVCIELLITHKFIDKNDPVIKLAKNRKIGIRDVEIAKIDSLVGSKAIHQGMLLKVLPLFGRNANSLIRIEDIVAQTEAAPTSTILVLDEVTDVHNVGAVLRTAACFNVDAVVLTEHNSPSESCGMAKASSGAIDIVPVVCIGNLVKTLEYLKQKNYWCYGFDASGGTCLHQVEFSERRVVILGAEGKGMRHLTKKHCDHLVKIPMSEKMESLNVSNAAAIAMYSVFLGDKSS